MHQEIDISDLIKNEERKKRFGRDEVYRQMVEENKMEVEEEKKEQLADEGASHAEEAGEDSDALGLIDSDDDDDDNQDENRATLKTERWVASGFIKPLRLLNQLSCYGNLTFLYKTLVSLAATSCSAERALSKNKIIKSPLRSTMLDPWQSCMMILASEVDIFNSIPNEEIIDEYARVSSVYAKLLKK